MMQRHEAQGTINHPEYMAAITLLNYRHVHRLMELPAPLQRSLATFTDLTGVFNRASSRVIPP